MTTKTIALDQEAYDLLKSQKGKGESFSDVVKRLHSKRRRLTDFAGAWKGLSKDEMKRIEEAVQRGRELDRERMAELLKRWG